MNSQTARIRKNKAIIETRRSPRVKSARSSIGTPFSSLLSARFV
jgi:hypothetical protein